MPNLNKLALVKFKLAELSPIVPQGTLESAGGGGGKPPITWRNVGQLGGKDIYYTQQMSADNNTTAVPIVDRIYATPFFVGANDLSADRLVFEVTSGGAAGSVMRAGIYNNTSESNLYPSSLVVDGGEVDTTTTGFKDATISETLSANTLYWFVYISGVAGPTCSRFTHFDIPHILGWPNGGSDMDFGWTKASVGYGALADPFVAGATPTATSTAQVIIGVRLA